MSVRQIAVRLKLPLSVVALSLRGNPDVPKETRARVLAEVRKLGLAGQCGLNPAEGRPLPAAQVIGVLVARGALRSAESDRFPRILAGARARARTHGYTLEVIECDGRVRTAEARAALDRKRFAGLLILGEACVGGAWRDAAEAFAVVGVDAGPGVPFHRVATGYFGNLVRTLDEVHARGYHRTGLVLARSEDERSRSGLAGAYFGWSEHVFGNPALTPLLRLDRADEEPLLRWLARYGPDAIVFAQPREMLPAMKALLQRNRDRVPEELGLAAVSEALDGTGFAGTQENLQVMGMRAVEILAELVAQGAAGVPRIARAEMISGLWREGRTLRRAKPGRLVESLGDDARAEIGGGRLLEEACPPAQPAMAAGSG